MRKEEIRNARGGIKTSGFFNAGLTPCSHTTTTTKMRHEYFLSDHVS